MQHNQGETFINYNDPLVIVIFHIFYFYYCLFLAFSFARSLVRLFFCLINYILICWSQSEIMQIFKSFLCLIFPQQFVIHSLTVSHSLLVAASYMESFLYIYSKYYVLRTLEKKKQEDNHWKLYSNGTSTAAKEERSSNISSQKREWAFL